MPYLQANQESLVNLMLFLVTIVVAALIAYLVWVAEHRPKSDCKCAEQYIDDANIRRVETSECKLNWGTRLFPFSHLTVMDVPVSSTIEIRYTPPGGIETELDAKYYEHNPVCLMVVYH